MIFASKINYDFFFFIIYVLSKFISPMVLPGHFDLATFSGAMGHTKAVFRPRLRRLNRAAWSFWTIGVIHAWRSGEKKMTRFPALFPHRSWLISPPLLHCNCCTSPRNAVLPSWGYTRTHTHTQTRIHTRVRIYYS